MQMDISRLNGMITISSNLFWKKLSDGQLSLSTVQHGWHCAAPSPFTLHFTSLLLTKLIATASTAMTTLLGTVRESTYHCTTRSYLPGLHHLTHFHLLSWPKKELQTSPWWYPLLQIGHRDFCTIMWEAPIASCPLPGSFCHFLYFSRNLSAYCGVQVLVL